MIRFECDYGEGCRPEILQLLEKTNYDQTPGYGSDRYCAQARERIRELCGKPDADIHFLVGGTQTNATVIQSVLRPYQGVLAAPSSHIAHHETGAIEHSGHKVLVLDEMLARRMGCGKIPQEESSAIRDSKITARLIQSAYDEHWNDATHEHIVQPGMVYISHPSENGILYSKKELKDISTTCRKLGLPLYLDGARLGYGLSADGNDLSLNDIAELADIFYIGGTKCGALFGEAVVITDKTLAKDFRYNIKMCGGMLAKGRLLGIQFLALLAETAKGHLLYSDICRSANEQAYRIRDAFKGKGTPLMYESFTNQQFPVLAKDQQKRLAEKFAFETWAPVDSARDAVRFCTSWATKKEDTDSLIEYIRMV